MTAAKQKSNYKPSKQEFMGMLEDFFTKKPEYLKAALHEVLEDLWAVKSAIKAKKSGLAKKSDVLKVLYAN